MSSKFEGKVSDVPPENWDDITASNQYLNTSMLNLLSRSNPTPFSYVSHNDYCCCEYKTKLNIFTFSKLSFKLNVTIIALPVSICKQGFCGDIGSLVRDYQRRKGIYLVLNMENDVSKIYCPTGKTLPTCLFYNHFQSFESYMDALRSGYRRRIRKALKKGELLTIKSLSSAEFDDRHYQLYLNVARRSEYPLEVQGIEFFQHFEGDITAIYYHNEPLAFVLTCVEKRTLNFVFGGMDYSCRDRFDLYYNMLITIIKKCIDQKLDIIDFGQTAENAKLRLGAVLDNKFMCVITGSPMLNKFFTKAIGLFEYRLQAPECCVFKRTERVSARP